jgi:hypothetical protein
MVNEPIKTTREQGDFSVEITSLAQSRADESSRRTAGLAGFFDLSQSGDRPVRQLDALRLDTMPLKAHLASMGEYGWPVSRDMLVKAGLQTS